MEKTPLKRLLASSGETRVPIRAETEAKISRKVLSGSGIGQLTNLKDIVIFIIQAEDREFTDNHII